MNKNQENPLFLGTLAPATGCRNPHPLSWIKFLGGIASLLVVSLSLGEAAQSVTLAWDANSEPNIVGYVLRYGTTQGKPSQSVNVDKTTTATVSNLASGKTYFFTVTARNSLGLESQPSNEVSYTTTTPSMVGSSNPPIGETKVLTKSDAGNGNLLVAQQADLTRAATIQSLSFYVTSASGKLRLGIFDATGPNGGPGAKKAETAEITPTVGWNEANVIAPVSLPQGSYWLAYLASDNNLAFAKNLSGQGKYYAYPYGPMPAKFSTSPQSEVVHWSLFATFSTSNEVSHATPGVAGSSETIIGESKVLTAPDSGNGNLLVAQQASLTRTATIRSLSFYVTNARGKLRLGIFDATGPNGGPGRKKAETAEITPTVGWNMASVVTPVFLPQGAYWLAYLASGNNLAFVKNLSGQARYYTYSYGPMPATFSTSPKSEVVHWSLFATLSTVLPTHALTVINGTGSGNYTEGTQIRVSASPPVAGQRFDGWTQDWQILTNPFIPTTTALMLSRDLTIEASYR